MKKLFVLSLLLISSLCIGAEQKSAHQQKKKSQQKLQQKSQQQKVVWSDPCFTCRNKHCPPGSTAAEKELAIMRKMSNIQSQLRK